MGAEDGNESQPKQRGAISTQRHRSGLIMIFAGAQGKGLVWLSGYELTG
jgi:hypothetical protein